MPSKAKEILGRFLCRSRPFPPPAFVEAATYREEGNQWFHPTVAGPLSYLNATVGAGPVRRVIEVLQLLKRDKFMDHVAGFYRAGLSQFGDDWVYADINTVLIGLARQLKVRSYLEIGVRAGRSMAMVAFQCPDAYIAGFDMWIANYAGMENPGPERVRAEMQQIGHRGQLELFSGDSHQTVPQYFAGHPERRFDLITVDGDHSAAGARADLLAVMPYVKVGGALVFDDVSNQSHLELRQVWLETVAAQPRFSSYIFEDVGFGVAFAIRKY